MVRFVGKQIGPMDSRSDAWTLHAREKNSASRQKRLLKKACAARLTGTRCRLRTCLIWLRPQANTASKVCRGGPACPPQDAHIGAPHSWDLGGHIGVNRCFTDRYHHILYTF